MIEFLSLFVRETIETLFATAMRRATQRVAERVAVYTAVAMLGMAALAFFYVMLFQLLADRFGPVQASAILVGGNLVLIALVLGIHALARRRKPPAALPVIDGGSATATTQSALDAGIALGLQIRDRARRATPQIVLAAALIGVVIGARPQVLTLFRRRARKPAKD